MTANKHLFLFLGSIGIASGATISYDFSENTGNMNADWHQTWRSATDNNHYQNANGQVELAVNATNGADNKLMLINKSGMSGSSFSVTADITLTFDSLNTTGNHAVFGITLSDEIGGAQPQWWNNNVNQTTGNSIAFNIQRRGGTGANQGLFLGYNGIGNDTTTANPSSGGVNEQIWQAAGWAGNGALMNPAGGNSGTGTIGFTLELNMDYVSPGQWATTGTIYNSSGGVFMTHTDPGRLTNWSGSAPNIYAGFSTTNTGLDDAGVASLTVDNFVFTAVPEPSSAIFMALGGMGLLRRRR